MAEVALLPRIGGRANPGRRLAEPGLGAALGAGAGGGGRAFVLDTVEGG